MVLREYTIISPLCQGQISNVRKLGLYSWKEVKSVRAFVKPPSLQHLQTFTIYEFSHLSSLTSFQFTPHKHNLRMHKLINHRILKLWCLKLDQFLISLNSIAMEVLSVNSMVYGGITSFVCCLTALQYVELYIPLRNWQRNSNSCRIRIGRDVSSNSSHLWTNNYLRK